MRTQKPYLVFVVLLLLAVAVQGRERQAVKIQIVASAEKQHVSKTTLHLREKVRERITLNAIISNSHVKLECQNERCADLAPGEYLGEIHGSVVRIDFAMPITNKKKHDEYDIRGSW